MTTNNRWLKALTEYFLAQPILLGMADTYGIELRHPWCDDHADRQIGGKVFSNHMESRTCINGSKPPFFTNIATLLQPQSQRARRQLRQAFPGTGAVLQ
jgi:hypothetical protein